MTVLPPRRTPLAGDTDGWRRFGAAVRDAVGDRDPVAIVETTPHLLAALIEGVAMDRLARPEGEGRWSVADVLAHLADCEVLYGWRVRQVLTRADARLDAIDQDAWVARARAAAVPPQASLAALAAMRAVHGPLLRSLTDADLARTGVHGERGPETLASMVRLWAGHDLFHVAQVERILRG
ncbi:MAG: DinB family protein [Gemmatimonadaceae bacterium]|jgi:uncharacterized damage-inducible protein DinB|nr:DinB family protein [Gemmatimonadaceae bacterium]